SILVPVSQITNHQKNPSASNLVPKPQIPNNSKTNSNSAAPLNPILSNSNSNNSPPNPNPDPKNFQIITTKQNGPKTESTSIPIDLSALQKQYNLTPAQVYQ